MIERIFVSLAFIFFANYTSLWAAQTSPNPDQHTQNIQTSAPSQKEEIQKPSEQQTFSSKKTLETILDGLEKRYSVSAFAAEFSQESTLKAMDITDTASGTVMVKRPGMMRWEYVTPEPQTIITDGENLWVYRPGDNQVMLGRAPAFFKDGKGAGFLSDMKLLREKFKIILLEGAANMDVAENKSDYRLKLLPEDPGLDLAAVFLAVDSESFIIRNIITLNAYEDETRIRVFNYDFNASFEDDLFRFKIPEGVDILELED